jgi:hypothetical protein
VEASYYKSVAPPSPNLLFLAHSIHISITAPWSGFLR